MVVRALRKELILDMNPGDPGSAELADGPHRVEWIAKTGAGIGENGNRNRVCNLGGNRHLFGQRYQRLRDSQLRSDHVAADVRRFKTDGLNQTRAERIIHRRQMQEGVAPQERSQC